MSSVRLETALLDFKNKVMSFVPADHATILGMIQKGRSTQEIEQRNADGMTNMELANRAVQSILAERLARTA